MGFNENIKNDLYKIYNIAYRELRKSMFPKYSRKKILWHKDAELCLEDTEEYFGRYECIETGEGYGDYRHRISISERAYNLAKHGCSGRYKEKRYYRYNLKNVIKHELIHAYIKEKFDHGEYGWGRDGSPIHAIICSYLDIPMNYRPREILLSGNGRHAKLLQSLTFQELEYRLIDYICDYEREFRNLKYIRKENILYQNKFMYDDGATGGMKVCYKSITVTKDEDNKDCVIKSSIIRIGMLQNLDNLKENIITKVDKCRKYDYIRLSKEFENIKGELKYKSMCI